MSTLTVLEESSNGIQEISLRAKHLSNRAVTLTGEVNNEMLMNFLSETKSLAGSHEPVDIILNSPGGSVNDGLAIYDTIQSLKEKMTVNIYCVGMAASMGAILLAGGQKGHRYILPHSKVMIHEPLIQGGAGGSATSIKKTADSILETKDLIVEILSKHTGKSTEEINEAISFDNFMNAEEAIAFGICDEIRGII